MKCNICRADASFLFNSENRHGRCLLSKDTFKIYECRECGVVFTDINVGSNYYNKYYPKDYYQNPRFKFFIKAALCFLQKISFWQKLKLIKRYKSKGNNILEIGCGKGDFLDKLPSYFKKYGVEINKCACQHIKEHYKDITLYNERIESTSFPGKNRQYDVIVLWHTLEHINNPNILFESITELLAKDGVIILEVPNRDGIGFNLTKKYWFHLDTPRHIFHYNYKSLNSLLKKYNFKIINYRSRIFDYPQDLAASLYSKFMAKKSFVNSIIAIFSLPLGVLIRFLVALFMPSISETNIYAIKQS